METDFTVHFQGAVLELKNLESIKDIMKGFRKRVEHLECGEIVVLKS